MNRRAFLAALGAVTASRNLGQLPKPDPEPTEQFITTLRYPYVQNVRADRASIIWTTAENGFGAVQYSADGMNFRGEGATTRLYTRAETGMRLNFYQHQVDLTGLNPGTDYDYQAYVDGLPVTAAGDLRFRTAAAGPFNFVVFGDSGWGSDEQFLIAQKILAERPALVLHTGDVVYSQGLTGAGPHDVYQRRYLNYYAASMSSIPFFPCPGNHDYDIQGLAAYLAIHSVPTENVPAADRGRYFSFDWGNVHFVSVDGHLSLDRAVNANGPMLRWLENDLRSTQQFWRIVYLHYPLWGVGQNEGDEHTRWARQFMTPILEANGVQVVLGGHEHSYQRSQALRNGATVSPAVGTTYFTSGGGGAFLYGVPTRPIVANGRSMYHYLRVENSGTRMTFRAIRFDGVEFENFTISPRPMFSDQANIPAVRLEPAPRAGSYVRIIGRALAAEETLVCTPGSATAITSTVVTINGRVIPILYASPSQLYAQLPFTPDGNITVRVTTPNGFSDISVNPR